MKTKDRKIVLSAVLFAVLLILIVFSFGCLHVDDLDHNPDPVELPDPILIEPGEIVETDYIRINETAFYFDGRYKVGTFANGDYWVLGPVTITRITPDSTNGHHGWQVNPSLGGEQSFDRRVGKYNATLMPALPYTAKHGESIVKTISIVPADRRPYIKSAVVLTIVGEIPPNNGASVFRPPYVGDEKPYHYLSEINCSLIPVYNISRVNHVPTLQTVHQWFGKVQLDHFGDSRNQEARPVENLPDYGAAIATRTANAALRLMLGGPEEEYIPALLAYLQCGLDYYYMMKDGWIWGRGSGESPGNKLPVVFFVTVMGNEEMKDRVRNTRMYEDYHVSYGRNGIALFGDWGWGSRGAFSPTEEEYWRMVAYDSGSRTNYDPYGYIDGGLLPGQWYQFCCTSLPFKGTALALLLMPALREVWNPEALFDYADRWVYHGAWTLPDPLAPVDGETDSEKRENWQKTWGIDPANPGVGIRNNQGRFPERHGCETDRGNYGSSFYSSMWDVYRASAPGAELTPPFAAVISNLEGETISGTIELLASAYGIHGVRTVQFMVDGLNIGGPAPQKAAKPIDLELNKKNLPYQVFWDTTQVANGEYQLTVVATDNRNNKYESVPVTVYVQN